MTPLERLRALRGQADVGFVAPQLALGVRRPPVGGDYVAEPKLDGWRCCAVVDRDGVRLYTRSGNGIVSLPYLERQLGERLAPGTVLDGELLAGDWNATQSIVSRRAEDRTRSVTYYLFDVLMLGGRDMMNDAQQERSRMLKKSYEARLNDLPNVALVPCASANESTFRAIVGQGFEGVVVKRMNSPYRPGSRSGAWLKWKVTETVDVVVTGLYEATCGSRLDSYGVGGLLADLAGVEIRIGTGMTDRQRAEWYRNPRSIIGKTVEVSFNSGATSRSGKVRHPALVRVRHSKDRS